MRTPTFLYLTLALSMVLLIGCNGNQQSQTQEAEDALTTSSPDYSGVYKSNKTGEGCDLTFTLAKKNDGYKYFLTGEHHDQEGKAIIEEIDAAIYITFDGPIGGNKPNTVSGQIDGNVIKIQNYGNSMNEYHFFDACDEKFLEFVK